MKLLFLRLVLIFLVFSCQKNRNKELCDYQEIISERVMYSIERNKLQLKSGEHIYNIDKNKLPFNKIILLNSSLLGFFIELEAENHIVALVDEQYIYSDKIRHLVQSKKIQTVGDGQKYDLEKIIILKPDAVFTNYIPSFENIYKILKNNGITIIFLDDYLEQTPLEKSAYIKLFGKLLGKEKQAKTLYQEIEKNYLLLKNKVGNIEKKPTVLANEMYGNRWFMAGGKTFLANFIKDAGAKYILQNNTYTKSIPISFEEIYARTKNTEYWVNAGNYSNKKQLLMANPIYKKLPVFHNGKIYSINGRQKGSANDLFESGTVRVDDVLKDYIIIFYPELLPKQKLKYMKELK